MALQRRHSDPGKPYNPDIELTNNQRKKFSETANKAEARRKQRDLYKAVLNPRQARAEAIAKAREKLNAQLNQNAEEQPKNKGKLPELTFLRVLIWSIVLGSFWVWILFMFPSN
ncbi:hypothetical protein P7F88_07845 [Vibrio hannami]|uniref:hypothetical protein n=1 Tax=Vibrio hannami TaxID=2717094 RepID=UPI00240EC669|nr:hypothetical protein [Vibrio hannami]MDG3086013.1 hypothetical protein [Vibrio hannami]